MPCPKDCRLKDADVDELMELLESRRATRTTLFTIEKAAKNSQRVIGAVAQIIVFGAIMYFLVNSRLEDLAKFLLKFSK